MCGIHIQAWPCVSGWLHKGSLSNLLVELAADTPMNFPNRCGHLCADVGDRVTSDVARSQTCFALRGSALRRGHGLTETIELASQYRMSRGAAFNIQKLRAYWKSPGATPLPWHVINNCEIDLIDAPARHNWPIVARLPHAVLS